MVTPSEQRKIRFLAPDLQEPCGRAIEHARELLAARPGMSEYRIVLWETWRSYKKQMKRFSRGRELVDGRWVVTNARRVVTWAMPDQSAHCCKDGRGKPAAQAFDLVICTRSAWLPDGHPAWGIIPTAAYLAAGDMLESGAMFKSIPGGDWPHIQRRNWMEHRRNGTVGR